MGKIIENINEKTKEGKEKFRESHELGKKAVSEMKSMKKLIDALPEDVDDEIKAVKNVVAIGTSSGGTDYMKSDVKSKIEEGNRSVEQASKEAAEQTKKNEQVLKTFQQMDSISNFGKSARETGKVNVEKSTQEFKNIIADNERISQEAEQEYENELSDIMSTF